ncbi:RidA family protein [Temperatibacter marinus]|uniref:RidA family protein n=1 Tax=Temperatibacter marinus TaxID=1456591 RepID=A0AA52EF29_9PROT|nr:RidA family protein [Temperatibacter marinus]WND02473.1 RidA family protein [Temperatibacter marinus]
MTVKERLEKLGITLPAAAAPVANYVPYVISGNLISISGQIPMGPTGLEFKGQVGNSVSPEEALSAARLCGINIIAQLDAALDGDLDRVVRIVKLGGFVNCVSEFAGQPQIINAASDLMVDVFGDKGRHSRSAVGTNALPLNVPVEIDALVEITA